jgi:acetate kinase
LKVLVVNAGSSSLKVSLIAADDQVVAEQDFETSGGELTDTKLEAAVHAMGEVEAVGHRVVHGGPRYPQSVRIDPDVIR